MPDEFDNESRSPDDHDAVERILEEMDIEMDPELREALKSGQVKTDVVRVESASSVRRNMEIEKSLESLRESLNLVEHNLMMVDEFIEKIERDIVPVILKFLMTLKGDMVALKESVIGRSRRRTKTNLQLMFIEKDVTPIVEEEFGKVEGKLTTDMSEPILHKIRDIVEGIKSVLQNAFQEMAILKSAVDDYTQRSSSEIEYLQTELVRKPMPETTSQLIEKLDQMERRVAELERDLTMAHEKLKNREIEIAGLQDQLAVANGRVSELEATIAKLRAEPVIDMTQIAELRQQIKALETTRDLLEEKVAAAQAETEEALKVGADLRAEIAARDLKIKDLDAKIRQMAAELEHDKERLADLEQLRAKLRSYESGDQAREALRIKTELARISAAHERLVRDHEITKRELAQAKRTIENYVKLMNVTEKTQAYLTVADVGEMTIRELARFVGVSPAVVMKWAEDYERLGLAKIVDDKIVITEATTDNATES